MWMVENIDQLLLSRDEYIEGNGAAADAGTQDGDGTAGTTEALGQAAALAAPPLPLAAEVKPPAEAEAAASLSEEPMAVDGAEVPPAAGLASTAMDTEPRMIHDDAAAGTSAAGPAAASAPPTEQEASKALKAEPEDDKRSLAVDTAAPVAMES